MNYIHILPPCGLYQEFYSPDPASLLCPHQYKNNEYFLDANGLFWSSILADNVIQEVAAEVKRVFQDKEDIPILYKAVAADPNSFSLRVIDAKRMVTDQGLSPQEFFSYVEMLNIYCLLYSQIYLKSKIPFTIQTGWGLPENSAEFIINNIEDEAKNPYLSFTKSTIMPILKEKKAETVFIQGRPGFASFTIAQLLKSLDPTICICITRHSSEYYSMNKIDHLLVHNSYLFRLFDVVILEEFVSTEKAIIESRQNRRPINLIPNIIYKSDEGVVLHTGYGKSCGTNKKPIIQKRQKCSTIEYRVAPDAVVNIHLCPNVKCYWNKCSFCGINQKYHFENPNDAYASLNNRLMKLKKEIDNSTYIWFIDEALPPVALRMIAEFFRDNMHGVSWQARCRIEQDLISDNLPKLLMESGLRELRLGLESGSKTVLRNMNKFDASFSFDLVERICQIYTSYGISIHFPIIIGFPGETESDRRSTYELLQRLGRKYKGVTFNINLFGLDIGSKVYRNWSDFDIDKITLPCVPYYFLGNIVDWDSSSMMKDVLPRERDQFMRQELFPWMPSHALTPPHIMYRLSETIRNTLLWKTYSVWPTSKPRSEFLYQKFRSGDLSYMYDSQKKLTYIYSWDSHHYLIGNSCIVDIINGFKTPRLISDFLDAFCTSVAYQYSRDDLQLLIERLVSDRYLISVD